MDFQQKVANTSELMDTYLENLQGDDKLNYLYFLRDEINKKVKATKKDIA